MMIQPIHMMQGLGEFVNEMATMMNQNKSNGRRNESFEDLQELFQEIFHGDNASSSCSATPPSRVSSQDSCGETTITSNKRNSSETSSIDFFYIGDNQGRAAGSRRSPRAKTSRPEAYLLSCY